MGVALVMTAAVLAVTLIEIIESVRVGGGAGIVLAPFLVKVIILMGMRMCLSLQAILLTERCLFETFATLEHPCDPV